LARLGALVGGDRIGAPAAVDSYRPGAFEMRPFADGHDDQHSVSDGFVSALRRCRRPVPARGGGAAGKPVGGAPERRGRGGRGAGRGAGGGGGGGGRGGGGPGGGGEGRGGRGGRGGREGRDGIATSGTWRSPTQPSTGFFRIAERADGSLRGSLISRWS